MFIAIAASLMLQTTAPAPDRALVQEMQEMAYIAGRCSVWMNSLEQAVVEKTITDADPRFMDMYREGVNDTDEGIRHDVCQRLLGQSRARIRQLQSVQVAQPIDHRTDAAPAHDHFIAPGT